MGRKIKTIKSVTLTKKINTAELVTAAKNIVFVPVKSICDSFLVESDLVKFIESIGSTKYVENSFPYNMISNFAYL